ncbi:vacuolar fusion protein ccz1 [Anaeramoeba ignava]|uniref:Vacuolar fusion protein ccz1 n=1 Tax=Anaeramoeba ignava TaxID=1746090 RepID=A0A9Q0LMW6_ANAIG|nr:vacuolar fusion protein ccz1 [Anaeramoeba ignava]
MSSKSSSSFGSFFIFNPTLSHSEETEYEKVIYFTPHNIPISKQMSHSGLIEGILAFSRTFSSNGCNSLHLLKQRIVFLETEKNFFVVLTVNNPFKAVIHGDKKEIEYDSEFLEDKLLLQILRNGYRNFCLLNGSFASNLEKFGIEVLKQKIKIFFSFYFSLVDFGSLDGGDSLLTIFDGIHYFSVDKNLYLRIKCFINQIESTFPQIKHSIFLKEKFLVWSSLDLTTTRALYNLLYPKIISMDLKKINSEISGFPSNEEKIEEKTSENQKLSNSLKDLQEIEQTQSNIDKTQLEEDENYILESELSQNNQNQNENQNNQNQNNQNQNENLNQNQNQNENLNQNQIQNQNQNNQNQKSKIIVRIETNFTQIINEITESLKNKDSDYQFLTGPKKINENLVVVYLPSIFIGENNTKEYYLIIYKANSIYMVFLCEPHANSMRVPFYSRLQKFMKEELTLISDTISKSVGLKTQMEQNCDFVYFNQMNLAMMYSNKDPKNPMVGKKVAQKIATIYNEFSIRKKIHKQDKKFEMIELFGDLFIPLNDTDEDLMLIESDVYDESDTPVEIVEMLEKDFWVFGKRSASRIYFLVFPQKNKYGLMEISRDIDKFSSTFLQNIYID